MIQQGGEGIGVQDRFAVALETDVGLATVGPVPDEHPVVVGCEGLGQLAQSRGLLVEAPARRDDSGSFAVPDQFVADVQSIDLRDRHGRHTSGGLPPDRQARPCGKLP